MLPLYVWGGLFKELRGYYCKIRFELRVKDEYVSILATLKYWFFNFLLGVIQVFTVSECVDSEAPTPIILIGPSSKLRPHAPEKGKKREDFWLKTEKTFFLSENLSF